MKLSKKILFLVVFITGFYGSADTLKTPPWFQRDLQRKASWLPQSIRQNGLEIAYQQRWAVLPQDVQGLLSQMAIPEWLIALIPTDANKQEEIFKQFRMMVRLAGSPAQGPLGQRAEQLLIFGGSAQLPTPGDKTSGRSLGPEGCTAAMTRYVLSQLKIEFPEILANLPESLATSQSSVEMKNLFLKLEKSGATWFDLKTYSFKALEARHIQPGSFMIGQKPGGTHVFGWTRVSKIWGWSESAKMAIGNTGLPQFGSRMILAQEYITDDVTEYDENKHNEHGPINSFNVIKYQGYPVLEDPRTNVYAAQGSQFIIINLH